MGGQGPVVLGVCVGFVGVIVLFWVFVLGFRNLVHVQWLGFMDVCSYIHKHRSKNRTSRVSPKNARDDSGSSERDHEKLFLFCVCIRVCVKNMLGWMD